MSKKIPIEIFFQYSKNQFANQNQVVSSKNFHVKRNISHFFENTNSIKEIGQLMF